jgi:hypothetical protein
MEPEQFNDAFLDTEYLKLDEGALRFIFTPERVEAALACPPAQVQQMLTDHHAQIVELFAATTRRILHEAFYMKLFEDLSSLQDHLAYPFIHLALRRIEDAEVESARVAVVKAYQARRKK